MVELIPSAGIITLPVRQRGNRSGSIRIGITDVGIYTASSLEGGRAVRGERRCRRPISVALISFQVRRARSGLLIRTPDP